MASPEKSVPETQKSSVQPEPHRHPYVSEKSEGKPWFEWCVAALVMVAAGLAAVKITTAAVILLAATSLAVASIRLIMRDKSPWKVRGIFFDCFIGFAFGGGLIATYVNILMMAK